MLSPESTTTVLPSEKGGSLSRAQRNEARLFALTILRDPLYQQGLLAAARKRELAPAVEIAIMHYGWGKPPDKVEVGAPGAFDLEDLPAAALADRAETLARTLRLVPRPPQEEDRAAASAQTDEALARTKERADARAEADAEASRIRKVMNLVTREEIGELGA